MICVPSTLIGVLAGAVVSIFLGKNLTDDREYQVRLQAGLIPPPMPTTDQPNLKPKAKLSAHVFLCGVALVVMCGFFPALRTIPGAKAALDMPIVIEIVMMSVAACSQAATTRAPMPLGVALGIPAPFLIGMFPAVNGYFFIRPMDP